MSPVYNYVTFAAAKQQLANRLYDTTKQFWSDSELGVYIKESIRTWNALTAYWRGDFTFQAQRGSTWYDLTDPISMPNTLRPQTVTDADLYTAIQYHLLEPVGPINPWTGVSAQFSADDVVNAVQRRRDELLSVTGCTLTLRTVPAATGRIALPDTVIDIRRMAFLSDVHKQWNASEPDAFVFNPALTSVYGKVLPNGVFQGEVASVMSAPTIGPDHFAEVTVAKYLPFPLGPGGNNHSIGPAARMTIDPVTGLISCYSFSLTYDTWGLQLIWEAGVTPGQGFGASTDNIRQFLVPELFGHVVSVGDVLRIEVVGNQITGKINGVIILGPVTDNRIADGAPGLEGYPENSDISNATQVSNFRAGPLPSGPIQVPPLTAIGDATIFGIGRIAVPVFPDDSWAEQSFNRGYLQQPSGTPSTYLLSTEPPISFDVDTTPLPGGNYELLTVEANSSTGLGILVPDDWVHVIKWGALADLLSRESNAKDSLRASYCEQRYRMGLALLASAPALLAMRIGNVPLQVDAVHGADLYNTNWQAAAPGTPATALHAGLNKLALSPTPDIGPYSLTATVVQNAPVPTADGDPVQVARDDLDVILDYAQHLAAFKMGGQEFLATIPLLQRFMKKAEVYGLKLAGLGEYTSVLYALSQRENQMNPRMAPSSDDGSGGGNG